MEVVRILAQTSPGSGKVTLHTTGKHRPQVVRVTTSQELFAAFRLYKLWLIQECAAAVDNVVPNLFQIFLEAQPRLYTPIIQVMYCSICGKEVKDDDELNLGRAAHKHCVAEEGLFPVNMVEPLVGWKGWNVSVLGCLVSSYSCQWHFEQAVKASCPQHSGEKNHTPPVDRCQCGIYAADKLSAAHCGPEMIRGELYGWGRYIRGGAGWRAQFAYPKSFLIEKEQMKHFEMLKSYKVPIFVHEPLRIYNPEDDGYESPDETPSVSHMDNDEGSLPKS